MILIACKIKIKGIPHFHSIKRTQISEQFKELMFIVVHVNLCAAVCLYDKDAISFYWSIIFHSGNKIDGRPVSQIEIFAIMRIRHGI